MEIDLIFKIAAVGIIVSILGQVLSRSGREEQATMTTLAGLVVVLILAAAVLTFLRPVMTFAQSLKELSGLGSGVMVPVVKALGIGFLTEIGKNICSDAGESAISGALGLLGGVAGIYVLLPLMESVLELIQRIL